MRAPKLGNPLILVLAAVAVVQLAFLGTQGPNGSRMPRPRPMAGDTLSAVHGADSFGTEAPLVQGQPTVLLVFHSRCHHCEQVASIWASWLDQSGRGLRTFAVSAEPYDSASDYVSAKGWQVEVRTLGGGRQASALTQRTPWVFVLDGIGEILAEGHGARIEELAGVLSRPAAEEPEL